MDDLTEIFNSIEPEYYLDHEGLDYKTTHGVNGEQLNLRECPACGNDKWKVYMGAETGLGNCFVCDEKFSLFRFAKHHLGGAANRDVVAHLKDVAREMGWRPKRDAVHVETEKQEVKLPLHYELPIDGQNLVYLEKRGVDLELVRYFKLLYCYVGHHAFKKSDGSKGSQNFSNRVLIPVFDLDGTLVTFQGRDMTGTAERKYLFPSGLPGTGRFLYNGQNVIGRRRIVMGEGAFDGIAVKKALDEDPHLRDVGVVGSFGKHLSYGAEDCNDQLGRFIQLRHRGLEEVTIMWDGEAEALKAAIKAGEMLKGIGLAVRVALLPKGCDPAEVSADAVRDCFRSAKGLDKKTALTLAVKNPYR